MIAREPGAQMHPAPGPVPLGDTAAPWYFPTLFN